MFKILGPYMHCCHMIQQKRELKMKKQNPRGRLWHPIIDDKWCVWQRLSVLTFSRQSKLLIHHHLIPSLANQNYQCVTISFSLSPIKIINASPSHSFSHQSKLSMRRHLILSLANQDYQCVAIPFHVSHLSNLISH